MSWLATSSVRVPKGLPHHGLSAISVEGRCTKRIDEIAELAGASRSTVRNSIKKAVCHDILERGERRVADAISKPNVLTVSAPSGAPQAGIRPGQTWRARLTRTGRPASRQPSRSWSRKPSPRCRATSTPSRLNCLQTLRTKFSSKARRMYPDAIQSVTSGMIKLRSQAADALPVRYMSRLWFPGWLVVSSPPRNGAA
jgi:hypothetical protein